MKNILILSALFVMGCDPKVDAPMEPKPVEPKLPPVACDAYITEPSANLVNGKFKVIRLEEGQEVRLCFNLEVEAEAVGILWNDVADYECNEATVSFRSTFAPLKETKESTGASGRLLISKNTGSRWGEPCPDCALPGLYMITLKGNKIFTKDDPNCYKQTVSWYWKK